MCSGTGFATLRMVEKPVLFLSFAAGCTDSPPFHLREKMIKYNKSDKIRKQMICYTNKGQDVQL